MMIISYAGRLNRFYGNYFYPYWRDPFYYSSSMWYPSMSLSFGYPYIITVHIIIRFTTIHSYSDYYYGGYYGSYLGYYSPYSYYPYSYSPYYYGGLGYYPGSYYSDSNIEYGRRERQSNYSSVYNTRLTPTSASSAARRESYDTKGTSAGVPQNTTGDIRRTNVSTQDNRQNTRNTEVRTTERRDVVRTTVPATQRRNTETNRNTSVERPEYNSVNRNYTPSYTNPRLVQGLHIITQE
jgi:hypothetical protein